MLLAPPVGLNESVQTVFYHQTQLINLARGQRGYFNFSRTFGQVIAATTGDVAISLAEVWKKLKASQQTVSGAQCGGIQPEHTDGHLAAGRPALPLSERE